MLSNKKRSLLRAKKLHVRVWLRHLKNANVSSWNLRKSWTYSARKCPERSKKWLTAWISPWKNKKRSQGCRRRASPNMISRKLCTCSRLSTWLRRLSSRMRKSVSLYRNSRSRKLNQPRAIWSRRRSLSQRFVSWPVRWKTWANKSLSSRTSLRMRSSKWQSQGKNGLRKSSRWSVN